MITPQTLPLHASPQQPAYILAGAPSLRLTGDHLRLLPKSVDLEERCAGVRRETLGDSIAVTLRDLRRESVREEEEGEMCVVTVMARPIAVAVLAAAQRNVRARACSQGGRKESSEDVDGVLCGPSYSRSCEYYARRVVHPLSLAPRRRPRRLPDFRHPHRYLPPIHTWSARSLAWKTHPPSSGQIPPRCCQPCLRTTWHGHDRGAKRPSSRSRSHSRGVEARNQDGLHSTARFLGPCSGFLMRSCVHLQNCQATGRGVHRSLGQQHRG